MSDQLEVKMSKWAYVACFAGDAVLLALAWVCFSQHGSGPLSATYAGLMVLCGALGSVLAVLPFFFEAKAAESRVETGAVVSMISQLESLEKISSQIAGATSQWQGVQESATKTAGVSKEIADKMMSEIGNFMKFMQDANDGEKQTMRLEIDKLRREENEFIQIIVRMLDHTFALHQASVRTGQPNLIEQLGHFQAACRDVARRVGLVPFAPAVNDLFDAKVHQSADSQAMPVSNARISEVIAAGYTYQGALLRPALVALQNVAIQQVTSEIPAEKAKAKLAEPVAAPAAEVKPAKLPPKPVAAEEPKPAKPSPKPSAPEEPQLL